MIQLWQMAYRDLGRNRRRSFFSALALGMGLALLLLMAAVLEGEMRGAMDASIRLETGHLLLRAASYDETKTSLAWEDLIENPEAIAGRIAELEPVRSATPRLAATGIVAVGERTAGVRVLGIDPTAEASSLYEQAVAQGEFLLPEDREGLLLGRPLAEKLHLQDGGSVSLLVNTADGGLAEQRFTVRGIYSTGVPSYDETTVLLPLAKAQAMSGAPGRASSIFVLLDDRDRATAVAAALQGESFVTETWEEANELLVQTEQYSQAYMIVMYLIVLGITATVVVNALVMAVFERTREIGILSAIGMRPGRVLAMFFAESALLALGGIAIGLLLGAGLVAYASRVGFYIGDMGLTGILLADRIYGYWTAANAIQLSAIAFVVTQTAALYPAWMAARMEPVEALRGGR
jgi:ABC-type lipoprotein release transport system permease subunit